MNNMKNITKTLIFAGLIIGFGLAFATPAFAAAPLITNINVSGISTTGATLNADIDPNGTTPTNGWFELGPSFNPVGQVPNINAIQTIFYNASGLTCGTTYNFNVGAMNTDPASPTMSFGNSFSTSPCPLPPDVTTAYNVNTTQTQTDLAGSVNPNSATTTVWFEYLGNPICGNQNIGSGSSPVAVNPCTFSGLQPNQSYVVTLNAINMNNTDQMTINFSTSSVTPPSISNVTANSVTQTSATLSAQINPNGSNTSGWFEVGPAYAPPVGNVNNILSTQTITYNLSGLFCATTYNFNAAAANLGGSPVQPAQFTTAGCGSSPTITTSAASGISTSGGTLNGSWNANGYAVSTWFEYDTDGSAPFTSSTTVIPQGLGSGAMAATINGLSSNTQYYFRACGSNSQGQNCGSVLNFTTNQSSSSGGGGGNNNLPDISSNSATSINLTSATLNGSWNANGFSTSTWFQYGISSSNLDLSTSPVTQGTGSGSMSANLTGLTTNTTYYFRAVGQNSDGTDTGSTLNFLTSTQSAPAQCADGIDNDNDSKTDLNDPGCSSSSDNDESDAPVSNSNAPQALTSVATEKTQTTAKLNGLIIIGASASTEGWFQYGKTVNLGIETNHQTVGSTGQNSFNKIATGLTSNTIYFFRAVAKNSYGTDYGDIIVFKTASGTTPPPVDPGNGGNNGNGGSGDLTPANITLKIETLQGEVKPGDIVNYTVIVKNEGGKSVSGANLKVALPKDISFQSASEGSFANDNVNVDLGVLSPLEESKISIEGRVSADAINGDILLATANLTYIDSNGNSGDMLSYATNKVVNLGLEAAVGKSSGKTLGWFLVVVGIILLAVLGREIYGKAEIRNFIASLLKK